MEKNKIKKILVIRDEHIGDYALSVPALRTLRENFPKAKIDIVVGPWNRDFAEATPYIDRIIVFDNPLVKRHIPYRDFIKPSTIVRLISFFRNIRKTKYDLLISFSSRKYNHIFLKPFRAERKISGMKFPYYNRPETERLPRILKSFGMENIRKKATLDYSKEDRKKIREIIRKNNLVDKKKIVVHTITPLEEKNWPLERWAELIDRMSSSDDKKVFLLIGSPSQKKEVEKIVRLAKSKKKIFNIVGELNIPQTSLLIKKSHFFISGDSGPKQLAEQLTNTPTLTLFGPTNEKLWGPSRKIDKVIKKEKMEDISVEEVLEEIEKIKI